MVLISCIFSFFVVSIVLKVLLSSMFAILIVPRQVDQAGAQALHTAARYLRVDADALSQALTCRAINIRGEVGEKLAKRTKTPLVCFVAHENAILVLAFCSLDLNCAAQHDCFIVVTHTRGAFARDAHACAQFATFISVGGEREGLWQLTHTHMR